MGDAVSGLVSTSFTTRQFNRFSGSLNAVGATPTPAVARVAIGAMFNPKLAPELIEGDYEVVGTIPMGAAYLLVKDRANNSLSKVSGLRFAAIDTDVAQERMISRVGGEPVIVSIANFAKKFNSGLLDVAAAPAMAIQPLELTKGMGTQGGIVRYPVSYVTMDVVIHRSRFPSGFGMESRRWFTSQLDRMFSSVAWMEKSISPAMWVEVPDNEKEGYARITRQLRMEMVQKAVYNKRMTTILKRVRCQLDKSILNAACRMNKP